MVVAAAGVGVVLQGLQSRGGPLFRGVSAPKGPPSTELQKLVDAGLALRARGLVPVLSTDPFTSALVLSTEDQSPFLFDILGERFAREALATTAEESRALFEAREAFIESRRVSPVFPITTAVVPVSTDPAVDQVREQVIQSLVATSPKVVAPGVVSGRTARSTRPQQRLGGPCAGITTGFQRLNCARGGFT